ncbi:MAG: PorV/PorQ family protein, partial [Candidatus Zixiibacteriota bacterium]
MKARNHSFFISLMVTFFVFAGMAMADENNSNAGTSVFDFLKIQAGARPVALGGAFTGVADDEVSLYYNPAGVVHLEGKRFIAGYHNNIFEMQSGFVGYIHPLSQGQKLSLYVNYLNYGSFDRTTVDGEVIGDFSGGDLLFAVSYAREMNEKIDVGVTGKLIYEKIDEYSASGVAVDLGIKYSLNDRNNTAFGLMVQNLGAQLSTYVDGGDKESLPLAIRGGGSSHPRGVPILAAVDVIYPTDNDVYFALGAELLSVRPLFVRVGWTNLGENYKTGASSDDFAGFSAGIGIEHKKVQISYTVSP